MSNLDVKVFKNEDGSFTVSIHIHNDKALPVMVNSLNNMFEIEMLTANIRQENGSAFLSFNSTCEEKIQYLVQAFTKASLLGRPGQNN